MIEQSDLHAPGIGPEPEFTPAVELRGVTKYFGKVAALADLSLAARVGEFLTLLGPSGCGKTTALRLISGLDIPDTGRVFLSGTDVTALPPHRREVNQVFQSYALFPHLNVLENVSFGLRMKKVPTAEIRSRTARALALVALDGLETRRPAQLSGGQRQRVALARALVCEPRVLLLDEPLSALDARLRAQVREELRALQRRLGLTFILVTHDQEEALAVSDRIAVVNRGRVEQIDSVENIYHRPASRFVASFVGETNLFEVNVLDQTADLCRCRLVGEGANVVLAVSSRGTMNPAPGRMVLMIRPENIHLRTPRPPADTQNSLSMIVEERVFQGAALMLTLRREAGLRLRALHFAGSGAAPLVGESVQVWFDPEKCTLLPADE